MGVGDDNGDMKHLVPLLSSIPTSTLRALFSPSGPRHPPNSLNNPNNLSYEARHATPDALLSLASMLPLSTGEPLSNHHLDISSVKTAGSENKYNKNNSAPVLYQPNENPMLIASGIKARGNNPNNPNNSRGSGGFSHYIPSSAQRHDSINHHINLLNQSLHLSDTLGHPNNPNNPIDALLPAPISLPLPNNPDNPNNVSLSQAGLLLPDMPLTCLTPSPDKTYLNNHLNNPSVHSDLKPEKLENIFNSVDNSDQLHGHIQEKEEKRVEKGDTLEKGYLTGDIPANPDSPDNPAVQEISSLNNPGKKSNPETEGSNVTLKDQSEHTKNSDPAAVGSASSVVNTQQEGEKAREESEKPSDKPVRDTDPEAIKRKMTQIRREKERKAREKIKKQKEREKAEKQAKEKVTIYIYIYSNLINTVIVLD